LTFGCRTLNDVWDITSDDVLVHALPLFHVHGLFVAAYCTLSSGATMRLLKDFDVSEILDAFGESTLMMGVPTHYTRLLDDERFTSESVTNMRLFVSGSAPMFAFHPRQVLGAYGPEDSRTVRHDGDRNDHVEPLLGERKPGTVGPALPGIEVRVTGGSPGSIEVRGPNVFAEYWNRFRVERD